MLSVSWYAIYRSDDLGETWDLVSTDPGIFTIGMHFISSTVGYRMEPLGSVEKTIDGGATWSPVFTRDPMAYHEFNAIFFVNEQVGYMAGEYVEKTTNGGISWAKIDWSLPEIIGLHFSDEYHGYLFSGDGEVYETKDGGQTWELVSRMYLTASAVEAQGDEIYVIGDQSLMFRLNYAPLPPPKPGYLFGPEQVCAGELAEFYLASSSDFETQWSTTAGNVQDQNG